MTNDNDEKVLSLSVIGVDDRAKKALKLFFKHNGEHAFSLVEETLADVFLVDMDGYDADERYKEVCEKYPNHPMILMSLSAKNTTKHQLIRKPINIKQLSKVLAEVGIYKLPPIKEKVAEELKEAKKREVKTPRRSPGHAASLMSETELHSFVGSAKDVDILNAQQLSSVYFDPANYLLGKLQQACSEAIAQQIVMQVVGLWEPITIFPLTGKVHVELSDRQLQAICVVSVNNKGGGINLADVEIKMIKNPGSFKPPTNGEYQDIETFLWKVALWTARGRIPTGLTIEKPVYLRAWPNFTRLIVTPHALRISACLVKHPRSLIDVATTLHIPQRYVFAFYAAAHHVGLAGQARRTSDLIAEPPKVQKSTKSGLLSRILGTLTQSLRSDV
jgi:hypothetical protein